MVCPLLEPPVEAVMAHATCDIFEGAPPQEIASDIDATTTASVSTADELSPQGDIHMADDFQDIDVDVAAHPRTLTWRLIWCSERCQKEENAATRKMLRAAAAEAGAALVCFKRASNFATWSAKSRRPPYALLADWREVKPCLSAVQSGPESKLPLLTLVHCAGEDPKVMARASAWARGCQQSDAVQVSKDFEPLLAFLRSRAVPPQQHALSSSPAANSPTSSTGLPSLGWPRVGGSRPVAPSMTEKVWLQAPLPLLASQRCLYASNKFMVPSVDRDEGDLTAVMNWVEQVAMRYGVTSLQQLDELLRGAAPDVYWD